MASCCASIFAQKFDAGSTNLDVIALSKATGAGHFVVAENFSACSAVQDDVSVRLASTKVEHKAFRMLMEPSYVIFVATVEHFHQRIHGRCYKLA